MSERIPSIKIIFELQLVKPEPNISSNKSAFLGPKIWKKPLHFRNGATGGNNGAGMEGNGTEFSVMNIDEFLNENNFDFDNFSRNVPEDERDQGMAMPPNGGNSYRYHKCNMFGFVSISIHFNST